MELPENGIYDYVVVSFQFYLVVTIRGDEADGGHQLDGLQHDQGHGGGDGPGQEGQSLLVVKQVPEPDLVVHDRLQTLDAFQLDPIPLRITATRIESVKLTFK